MKAFLVCHDEPFQKTHDLGRLGTQAVQIDPTLEPLVEGIVDLTKYAWLFRYPGDPVGPTAEEASDALGRALRVLAEVLARLPDDAHPSSA